MWWILISISDSIMFMMVVCRGGGGDDDDDDESIKGKRKRASEKIKMKALCCAEKNSCTQTASAK